MPFSVSISDVIAVAALGLSGYAIWRQKPLFESQKRLNALLLEQGENEALDARKADISASFVKLGKSKYRLKIFNKGKATARNVRIEFPDGDDVILADEVSDKFPMEVMEQHHSVDLIAAVHMGTKRKHPVKLIWADDFAENNEKTVYPTI